MHGRLSGTGRLHRAVYSSRNNWFRWFLICNNYPHRPVCKFWYNQLLFYEIRRQRGCVLAWSQMCLFNCFRSALFFAYWFHNSYWGKHVSCLGTAESHLKCNALLLQARVHNIERARETYIYIIIAEELCRSLKEQSTKWRDFISTLK